MRKTAVAACVFLLSTGASVAFATAPNKEVLDHCNKVSAMAEATMEARQSSVPMAKMMSMQTGDEATDSVSSMLIIDAYKYPVAGTKGTKAAAASEFSSKWFAACLQTKSKQ